MEVQGKFCNPLILEDQPANRKISNLFVDLKNFDNKQKKKINLLSTFYYDKKITLKRYPRLAIYRVEKKPSLKRKQINIENLI